MSQEPVVGGPARTPAVEAAFADHWPVLVARLVRRYGDVGLAEDRKSVV